MNDTNSAFIPLSADEQEEGKGSRAAHCVSDSSIDSSDLGSEIQSERDDGTSDIDEETKEPFADAGPQAQWDGEFAEALSKKWTSDSSVQVNVQARAQE